MKEPVITLTLEEYEELRKEHECLEKEHAELQRKYEASLQELSLIHISEPTRLGMISYAVFCLKKKKQKKKKSASIRKSEN